MTFGDRLKQARINAGLSQNGLAERTGLHYRTIQNWEAGSRKPQNLDMVMRVAGELNTTCDELLGEADICVIEAEDKGGARARRDVEELVGELSGLFAGGELDEDEKAGVIAALNQAYWVAKEKNQKYTPKKYLKNRKRSNRNNI